MWQLLSSPQERGPGERALAACQELPQGPGLVIGSGGSSQRGRRWCLQPLSHLEAGPRTGGRG
ncbi:MAG: hypothetical protein EBU30_06165 [Synechococcaceae bacterium WB6_3B_236]|nr:hypothetical protein [Synechococcaceae bacterium WB6_3B_236]